MIAAVLDACSCVGCLLLCWMFATTCLLLYCMLAAVLDVCCCVGCLLLYWLFAAVFDVCCWIGCLLLCWMVAVGPCSRQKWIYDGKRFRSVLGVVVEFRDYRIRLGLRPGLPPWQPSHLPPVHHWPSVHSPGPAVHPA